METIIDTKAYPLPIEMRPIWRISLIVLAISILGNDKGYLDLKKINILVWMLIRKLRWEEYEAFLDNTSELVPVVSVDTAQYTAVELAISEGFISVADGRLYLEELGNHLYQILTSNDLMTEERGFLIRAGKRVTKTKIDKILGKK